MDKVQKNMEDIIRKLGKANKIAEKNEKINYADAIKLGQKSNSINSTIRKGIKEYSGASPSDAEAKKILSQVTQIVELTEKQLGALTAAKGRFDELKVGGLVKKNVGKSDEASKELEQQLLAKSPADLKPQAEELAKRRAAAFQKANAAFSGLSGGEDQADAEDDSD